jgi:hypothetical protein
MDFQEKKHYDLILDACRIAMVGGWEFDTKTMKQVWTDEVYVIHEVDKNQFDPDVSKGVSFYSAKSKPIIEKAVGEAVQLGKPFDLELDILTAKGNRKIVRAIGQAEVLDGVTRRVYGPFQDITKNKEIEDKLREKVAELEKLNRLMVGRELEMIKMKEEIANFNKSKR